MAILKSDGTWLDPEELAYPAGSLRQSRRRAWARCSDGVRRTIKVGIPDTYFSIPGWTRVRRNGKQVTIAGYVTSDETGFMFRQYLYRKNASVLPKWETDVS